jgi:HAD superfamily hydrolase (TIGR01549 family)
MKPNPWPLLRALDEIGGMADQAIFIGDSLTDIEASQGAGCHA